MTRAALFALLRRAVRLGLRLAVLAAAAAFALQVALAVFGIPTALHAWLTGSQPLTPEAPRYIVVLGGGGIPSESGLMRTYCAAHAGVGRTGVTFVVCLPADRNPETSSVGRMRDELVMRGIPREAVLLEHRGRNTREQAAEVHRLLGSRALAEPLLVVTSPYHVRRSLLCFRKEGFRKAAAMAAQGTSAEADMGGGEGARYGFWNALETEVRYARELTALLIYRLRGWI